VKLLGTHVEQHQQQPQLRSLLNCQHPASVSAALSAAPSLSAVVRGRLICPACSVAQTVPPQPGGGAWMLTCSTARHSTARHSTACHSMSWDLLAAGTCSSHLALQVMPRCGLTARMHPAAAAVAGVMLMASAVPAARAVLPTAAAVSGAI
jgi:hypothetical protein